MALSMNLFRQWQKTLYFNLRHGIILNTTASSGVSSSSSSSRQTISCTTKLSEQTSIRRSANYQPSNWDYDYVQSLKNEYAEQKYIDRADVLKKQVKMMMLDQEVEPLHQLELIDDLQRLGLSYHFRDEIQFILSTICKKIEIKYLPTIGKDLYATSLAFRLLRQHDFDVSHEIFSSFKDEKGDFEPSLCQDIKGILHLYEASYLQTENESTLDSARDFAAKHLREKVDGKGIDQELAALVQHALELPLHWRMLRLEARWFLDVYEKRADRNPTLVELAKLDFNILQAIYQDDLKHALRWWRSTGLAENLTFARDRLVENFFWTIGVTFDPQLGYCRRMSTRIGALITTIDDVYDVYGTLDELKLFTDAVERWDIEAMSQLPDYMKICYFALYNSTNQMAYDVMKEQGIHIIPFLKNAWADLCKAYFQEAKWYYSGHVPTLAEYLDNAWISVSAPVILVHNYFFVTNPIKKEALEHLIRYHNIIHCSSIILRLADDLGTSSYELQRGDVPKAVQCYMNESGASEEEAREYIRFLIGETWKEMNKERVAVADSPLFPQTFVALAMNVDRMALCMYQHGDGHGYSNAPTKDRIRALVFEPVGLPQTQKIM